MFRSFRSLAFFFLPAAHLHSECAPITAASLCCRLDRMQTQNFCDAFPASPLRNPLLMARVYSPEPNLNWPLKLHQCTTLRRLALATQPASVSCCSPEIFFSSSQTTAINMCDGRTSCTASSHRHFKLVIPLRDIGMVQEPLDTNSTFVLGLSTPGRDVRFFSRFLTFLIFLVCIPAYRGCVSSAF